MINKSIVRIRKKLDKLDNKFLDIIKKRAKLVDLVIKNKKYKKDIIDKKRNLDTKVTQKIWISMINAFIDYEYRNFKKK